MKTFVVCEYELENIDGNTYYNLAEKQLHDCTGCWSCWWKTPGRCAFKDLDEYYRGYLNADKVVFFLETKTGFVSRKVKGLFDRMIPLFLPYTHFHTGESMHNPRYDKYPDIEIYYKDDFVSDKERTVFEAYMHRTFFQFQSKNIQVKQFSEFKGEI